MAEFGISATQLAAPRGAGSQPIEGVGDATTDRRIPGAFLDIAEGAVKASVKKSSSPILATLNDTLNSITAGRDSGAIGAVEAATRARVASREALAAAGGDIEVTKQVKELTDTYRGVTSLGTATDDEKFNIDMNRHIIKELTDMGFPVPENPSPEHMNSMREAYQTMKSAAAEFKQEQDNLAYQASHFNLSTSQAKQAAEQSADALLVKMLPTMTDDMYWAAQDIRKKVGDGVFTLQQGMLALEERKQFFLNQAEQMYAAFPEKVTSTKRMLEDWTKSLGQSIDPNAPADQLEAQLRKQIAANKLMALTNGDTAAAFTFEQLFPGNPYIQSNISPKIIGQINTLSQMVDIGRVSSVGNVNMMDSAAKKDFYGSLKSSIITTQKMLSGDRSEMNPVDTTYRDNLVNNTLAMGAQMALTPESVTASDAMDFVSFLSSDEYKIWSKTGVLNEQARMGAQDMFENVMLRKVQVPTSAALNMKIQDVMIDPNSSTLGSGLGLKRLPELKAIDLFTVEFDGNAVRFVPRVPEGLDGIDPRRGVSQDVTDKLGKTAQVLNTLIKAGANVSGATSTKQYWDANKHNILPYYFPPNQPNLKVGEVVNGMEYIGGAVSSKYSWRAVRGDE